MTFDSITTMRSTFEQALQGLEYTRAVLNVSAHSDVSTRDVSIAITQLETANLWARRALQERELSATEPIEENPYESDPEISLEKIWDDLDSFVSPLKAEYINGSSERWYRNAILQTYNHLEIARQRVRMQLEAL